MEEELGGNQIQGLRSFKRGSRLRREFYKDITSGHIYETSDLASMFLAMHPSTSLITPEFGQGSVTGV